MRSQGIIYGDWYELERDSNGHPKKLGDGAFGSVLQATNFTNGRRVAIKVTHADPKEIFLILKIPRHKNIVRLLDYWIDAFSQYSKYLVMNIADCDLSFVVENEWNGNEPSSDEMTSYVTMLIDGVLHLHDNKIIHRDLKPANVLRFEEDNGAMVLKIADFGISKQLDSTNQQHSTIAGSTTFMAPEMLLEQKYTKQVDIWALGLVLYYMCMI